MYHATTDQDFSTILFHWLEYKFTLSAQQSNFLRKALNLPLLAFPVTPQKRRTPPPQTHMDFAAINPQPRKKRPRFEPDPESSDSGWDSQLSIFDADRRTERSILHNIVLKPTERLLMNDMKAAVYRNAEKEEIENGFANLVSKGYLKNDSGDLYELTLSGRNVAKNVRKFEESSKTIKHLRDSFDRTLALESSTLHRVNIARDGNCLHESVCVSLGIPVSKKHEMRLLSVRFAEVNLLLFETLFEKLRESEDFAHYNQVSPVSTIQQWIVRNRCPGHFDDYGQLHLLSYQFLFNFVLTVVDSKNRLYYPRSQCNIHFEAVQPFLDDQDEQHLYQRCRMVLLSGSSHYEAIVDSLHPMNLDRCLVESFPMTFVKRNIASFYH